MSARITLAVAAGSAIGGVLRYGVGQLPWQQAAGGLPWATLIVNVLGSLVIGWFATITEPDGRLFVGTTTRQFVMTGICGGFTTFSVFSLESLMLLQQGAFTLAILNMAGTICLCLLAVWAGHALASRSNSLRGTGAGRA